MYPVARQEEFGLSCAVKEDLYPSFEQSHYVLVTHSQPGESSLSENVPLGTEIVRQSASLLPALRADFYFLDTLRSILAG
jgi:hypothetical protein